LLEVLLLPAWPAIKSDVGDTLWEQAADKSRAKYFYMIYQTVKNVLPEPTGIDDSYFIQLPPKTSRRNAWDSTTLRYY